MRERTINIAPDHVPSLVLYLIWTRKKKPKAMKLYFAILLMLIGVTWAAQVDDSGQPGCKTPIELQVRNYRNTWDPTRYWICEQLGQPAVATKCPGGTGWLDSQKSCVDWAEWEWEAPEHPPSKP